MTACSSSPAAAGPFLHHNATGWMDGWEGGQSPPSLSYSSRDGGWEEETEERPLPSLGHGLAHSSAGIGPPLPAGPCSTSSSLTQSSISFLHGLSLPRGPNRLAPGAQWAGRRPTGAFIFVVVVRCFVVVFVHPWLSLSFRRIAFALLSSSSSSSPSSLSRATASNCLLFVVQWWADPQQNTKPIIRPNPIQSSV
ncbi:hypothetical protein niasHT_027007 [Heterodera trifolii]|uniref:Uncharacterized protein n=1 Tax=Heterodera trifolii TaxID=157864 RepID=A0ABD2JIR9_9BILA